MMFKESLRMSVKAVTSNKMRSFLTMLGIIIGVMSLIVLVSIVNGARDSVTDSINSMGTNTFTVRVSDDKGNPLALSELTEIIEETESVSEISATVSAQVEARNLSSKVKNTDSSEEAETVNVTGTNGSYAGIKGLTLMSGRYFNITDVENHTNVAVISQDLAEDVMGSSRCIGENIQLSGVSYEIIGVTESSDSGNRRGGNSSSYRSYEAYVPYTSLLRLSDSVSSGVTSFVAAAESEEEIDRAETELTSWMLARFSQDSDAFTIQNQSEIAETMEEVQNTMAMMLGGIAGISLLVGGIGIMNIMLVSVTERTREIGIRKAIGASHTTIMLQFLIEAMILSLMGCLVGIVGSLLLIHIIGLITGTGYHLAWNVAGFSVLFSSAIGIAFGLYPAGKAAGRNPIEALRYTG